MARLVLAAVRERDGRGRGRGTEDGVDVGPASAASTMASRWRRTRRRAADPAHPDHHVRSRWTCS